MFTSPLQVEAVLGSFMQLREESNINMGEAVMEGVFDFNDDDDDLQIGKSTPHKLREPVATIRVWVWVTVVATHIVRG